MIDFVNYLHTVIENDMLVDVVASILIIVTVMAIYKLLTFGAFNK